MAARRACADDLGAALATISATVPLYHAFCIVEEVSTLSLAARNMFFVVLARPITLRIVRLTQTWLSLHVPNWARVNVVFTMKCLGC